MANKTVFTSQPTSSAQNPVSRYVQGGVTDVYNDRLGWWNGFSLATSATDVTFPLDPKYHQRPDLLAYDAYGKATFMWLVLQYNHIVDVNEEFVTGATITLPTKTRVLSSIMVNQEGGNPVSTLIL